MEKQLTSIEHAAVEARVSARTVYRWLQLGQISSTYQHGRRLVALSDVLALAAIRAAKEGM